MAEGPAYRVPFKRRREGKTDYKARKALVISKLPRVVTRGTKKHMIVQIIEATATGDRIIASATSQELKKYDWQGATGNLPSAYLTGLLCGMRALAKNVQKAIADIGLHQPTKAARIFAAIKGVVDAGINVPHNAEKLPDEKRLKGQHIADYAKRLASANPELYQKAFSNYLKNKLSPENLPEHFEATKKKIAPGSQEKKSKGKNKEKKEVEST